jgi:hypothetical protein
MTTQEEYYKQRKQEYGERLDTPKPCECGDTVKVTQISGVAGNDYYPMYGTVTSVKPRQMTNGRLGGDWIIRVRFTEDGCNGAVFNGTTELFAIGGRREVWENKPIELLDE